MNYRYHRLVQRDVNDAVAFYEEHANDVIADEFYQELIEAVADAATNPKSYPFLSGSTTLRRMNLKRFPFHFLYKVRPEALYVVVVRHHNRHPRFGLRRKI